MYLIVNNIQFCIYYDEHRVSDSVTGSTYIPCSIYVQANKVKNFNFNFKKFNFT